jgi:hypothetical protein
MARAESLTVEGACPSAQLIEPSAVALLAAVRDHFQQPHCRTSKAKAPRSGAAGGSMDATRWKVFSWKVQAQGRALPRHPRGRPLDEAQFATWVKQASLLPGERM